MKRNSHKCVTLSVENWNELTRIKYARGFSNINEVITDLLEDEEVNLDVH